MRRRVYSLSTESESSVEVIAINDKHLYDIYDDDDDFSQTVTTTRSSSASSQASSIFSNEDSIKTEIYDEKSVYVGEEIIILCFEDKTFDTVTTKSTEASHGVDYFSKKRLRFEKVY